MSKYGLVWHQVLSWHALASPHFAFIAFNLVSAFLVDLRPCCCLSWSQAMFFPMLSQRQWKGLSFAFWTEIGNTARPRQAPIYFDTRHKTLIVTLTKILWMAPKARGSDRTLLLRLIVLPSDDHRIIITAAVWGFWQYHYHVGNRGSTASLEKGEPSNVQEPNQIRSYSKSSSFCRNRKRLNAK